ncbi:hypothetical protein KIW84_041368 [Lathyrus oleraceus]|uniref:DUF4283 domain-containing protein n=1 Tax=Pisum sativum TaxID=3888 RepID=A0A9D4X8D3_PEA|nr:hypothetical protein KIW84_041368 [Pisum sativum]
MQEMFHFEGYFSVKVTPMGANLCLLEDLVDGEMKSLIEGGRYWLGKWFKEIRKWKSNDVDLERVMWLRCCGLPCHARNQRFFELVIAMLGVYICSGDNTSTKEKMDVARLMIRARCETSRKIINVVSGPKSDDLEMGMSTRDSEEEDRDMYIEVGKYDEDKLDNKIDVICEEVNGDKALVVLDRADDRC